MSARRVDIWAWVWAAWFLVAPLGWPRGEWGFGYYRLRDIVFGLGLALAGVVLTVLVETPWLSKEKRFRATSALLGAVFGAGLADVAYVILIRRPWDSNMWLDNAWVEPSGNRTDPELGFKRRAHIRWGGLYRTDENGFPNPPGIATADVVFVGDSFTEAGEYGGLAETETFVRQTGAMTGLSVVNLGTGGYGPQQELVVLRRYGFPYRPRIVVWQLFEGNDLQDAERYARWREAPEAMRLGWLTRYANYSLAARLLATTIRQRGTPRHVLRLTDGRALPLTPRSRYVPDAPDHMPTGVRELARSLEEGAEECRKRGTRLIVVTIPVMVRVLGDHIDFVPPHLKQQFLPGNLWRHEGDFDSRVRDICQRLGCDYVDTLPELRRQAVVANDQLFIPNNEHLAARGHQVVAAVLARRILKAMHTRPEDAATAPTSSPTS